MRKFKFLLSFVLIIINASSSTKAEVVKTSAADLARADSTESNASTASASAMFSAASAASAATSISTSSIKESSAGKLLDSKLDLDQKFQNADGVLGAAVNA